MLVLRNTFFQGLDCHQYNVYTGLDENSVVLQIIHKLTLLYRRVEIHYINIHVQMYFTVLIN